MNPTDEMWAAGGEPYEDEDLLALDGTCPVCCEVLDSSAVEVRTTFGAAFVCPGCDLQPAPHAPRSTTMTPVPASPPPAPPRRPQQAPKGAPEVKLELGRTRFELHRSKATE